MVASAKICKGKQLKCEHYHATYLFPQNNVDISIKGAIDMHGDIQVKKITEMMVHVHNCKKTATPKNRYIS